MKSFEVISEITNIESIAVGTGIRDLARLRKRYGSGRWRKVKGIAIYGVRNFTGTRRTASAGKSSNVNGIWTKAMKTSRGATARFAICVDNSEYPASLELHKIYRLLPDEDAAKDGDLRVIDESGEDYLYPADYFVLIDLPRGTVRALNKSFARSGQQGSQSG